MYFRIPELGSAVIAADPALRPILILTSNSEKGLPDAFLRRCVYYNIPFPDRERLARIVTARLGRFVGTDDVFLNQALDLFSRLREPATGLRKPPATAELLAWLVALHGVAPGTGNPLTQVPDGAARTLSVLIKSADDLELAKGVLAP